MSIWIGICIGIMVMGIPTLVVLGTTVKVLSELVEYMKSRNP